jgi:hypothetical protein
VVAVARSPPFLEEEMPLLVKTTSLLVLLVKLLLVKLLEEQLPIAPQRRDSSQQHQRPSA